MSTFWFTLDLDIQHRDRYSQRNSSRVLPWACLSLTIYPPLLVSKVATLVEGNEVGGSFYLNDTDAIAADASAEDMETLLEATDLGDVNVTRSETKYGRVCSSIVRKRSYSLFTTTALYWQPSPCATLTDTVVVYRKIRPISVW